MRELPSGFEGGGLLRSTAFYGSANLLQKAVPFLLLPVTTRFLSPEDFGIVAIFTVVVGIATPLAGLNAPSAVARRYFDPDRAGFPAYVAGCLALVGVATLLTALLGWPLAGTLASNTGLPAVWLLAAVAVAGGQSVVQILLSIWQAGQQAGRYMLLQTARTLLTAGLMLWLVVALGWGWRGPVTALLATTGVILVGVCLPGLKRWVGSEVDRGSVQHALRYGGGLIPHTLAGFAILGADRFFIGEYVGVAQVGLYSVGYQLGMVVALGADALNRAWTPWLYGRLQEGGDGLQVVRLTYGLCAGIALLAVAVTALAPLLVETFLAAEFGGAEAYVGWIALGFAFDGMYRIFAGYVFFSQKTLTMSRISVAAAAANLVLNFVLVPRYGALGAAHATAITFLARFLLTWHAARRLHPLPWSLRAASG